MAILINPPAYGTLFTALTPNHKLNTDCTNYASLIEPYEKYREMDNDKFYKYDYHSVRVRWGFRSFDSNCEMRYNMFLFTDHGIFYNDMTHNIYEQSIYMRHWEYFTQITETEELNLFIVNKPSTKEIMWFKPSTWTVEDDIVTITDTEGALHSLTSSDVILDRLRHGNTYIEVQDFNYIPVYLFHMWVMVFQ